MVHLPKMLNIKRNVSNTKAIYYALTPSVMSICQHKSEQFSRMNMEEGRGGGESCAKYQMSWINNHGNGFSQFVNKKKKNEFIEITNRNLCTCTEMRRSIVRHKKECEFHSVHSHFNWNRKFILPVAKRNDRIGDNVVLIDISTEWSGTFTCAIKRDKHSIQASHMLGFKRHSIKIWSNAIDAFFPYST